MSDLNRFCGICTDGANSAEFTVCAECYERLKDGLVALKCLACGEHKFLLRNERTKWRIRKILDLWDFHTRPGICAYKTSAIVAALYEDAARKALIIYLPSCPKCYKAGAGEGYDPAHPLTIMQYKIACFGIEGLEMHEVGKNNFFTNHQEKIIH